MAKQRNTSLQTKYRQLPKSVVFEKDILPELQKAGITARTFQRDRDTNPNNIPHGRLLVYAALFNCDISELIDGYSKVKVKSIVGSGIAKRIGLRTSIFIGIVTLFNSCLSNFETCGTVTQITAESFLITLKDKSNGLINLRFETSRPDTVHIGQKLCFK